jgi:hypothetical protein
MQAAGWFSLSLVVFSMAALLIVRLSAHNAVASKKHR